MAHKDVKYWYKFRNNIEFDGVMFEVTFNIRDKGKEQYEYLINFKEIKGNNPNHTIKNNLRPAGYQPSGNRISQPKPIVNNNSMQNSNNDAGTVKKSKQSTISKVKTITETKAPKTLSYSETDDTVLNRMMNEDNAFKRLIAKIKEFFSNLAANFKGIEKSDIRIGEFNGWMENLLDKEGKVKKYGTLIVLMDLIIMIHSLLLMIQELYGVEQ